MDVKQKVFSRRKGDFIMQTFTSGGPGGQNQNKVATGVRLIDRETGLRAESREHRTQIANKKAAFRKLVEQLVIYYCEREDRERYGSQERVRTYNEAENYVKDHLTGEMVEFKTTAGKGDIGDLIERRTKEALLSGRC